MAFWIMLILLTVLLFEFYFSAKPKDVEISYSRFFKEINAGNIASLTLSGKQVTGELKAQAETDYRGRKLTFKNFKVWLPTEDADLPDKIWKKFPGAEITSQPEGMNWIGMLVSWLPIVLIVAFWLFIMRQMQAGGSAALKFGRSKAKVILEDRPKVTFRDVAGADEAKQELEEIIEFLKEPKKFQRLGGRIPKGALLLGPPGTGKTLLAKAVAGEANVPFYSMSGSDFVEMFVGVGASRVRDLFDQGKKNAPCIIFIDEIDAVGRQRGAGLGGGHDEREQTLNQLLVEMDGFDSNEGVILLAATNRPDVLDPALLRPGRFDRQIVIDRPDVRGREGIFRVHTRGIPLSEDVDLKVLARATPGLAGADLANLVNEAALLAARRNRKKVLMEDFEEAKDKVMMGTERRSLIISDEEKRTTSYHEAGHTLIARLQPGSDPIHKVTIIPRGRALGLTHLLPIDERYTRTRDYLLMTLTTLMGGRAAEELVLNQITNGAANDIETATEIARKMVCEWGMSERLGPVTLGKREELIFLGREISQQKNYSEKTAVSIDEEIKAIVEGSHEKARKLLLENREKLNDLAIALLEREILDSEEIDRVLRGEKLEPVSKTRTPRTPAQGQQEIPKINQTESPSGTERTEPREGGAQTQDAATGEARED
ncbi:MAG: ATP-dependent zinc metalloprotease FtsH [Candidatus Eisenbacteria bacterium]|nr:ATP-dependent zinc metalloprotease FtsH [Candidatus Eisenbacteria bacterium]